METFIDEDRSRRTVLAGANRIERADFASRTRLLCWILGGVVLVFFALSTNQEYYTFPAYLPLLIVLADGVAQCERMECAGKTRAGWLVPSAALLALIGIVASSMLALG